MVIVDNIPIEQVMGVVVAGTEQPPYRARRIPILVRGETVYVKKSSRRLKVFKLMYIELGEIHCVACGRKATHFRYERCGDGAYYPHLNLYGDDVLFTKDHILPKARGGSNSLHNLQVMCIKCNAKKGNKIWLHE